MINELLVALANKTQGFSSSCLNVMQTVNFVEDAETNRLRGTLFANTSEQNYIGLMNIMYSFPTVTAVLPKGITTFDGVDMYYGRVNCRGGRLIASAEGAAYIAPDLAPGWGGTMTCRLTDDALEVTTSLRTYVLPKLIQDDVVTCVWPPEFKIRGNLQFDGTTDIQITMQVPSDWERVVERVDNDPAFIELLTTYELSDAYYFADSTYEKVAILGLTLYYAFKQLNP